MHLPFATAFRSALPALFTVGLLGFAGMAWGQTLIHVAPDGDDGGPGTREMPFRSLDRAQEAAREAARAAAADVVVELAPGTYRLDRPLAFTEEDSGRAGFRVIYRSGGGIGQARLYGSMPLVGWEPYRDGIWRIALPEGVPTFHTLYENGRRAWKARFPNYEHHPDQPTARGRYLVSVDGSPQSEEGENTGWLAYGPDDIPPVTDVTQMRMLIFSGGKCNWFRELRRVVAIDPEARRIVLAGRFGRGVGAQARYFLEGELGLLDAPGEFHLDEADRTLYYYPLGDGHPDTLGIAAPVLNRLVQLQGASREQCVEHLVLEGLAFEETDDSPPGSWWSAQFGARDGALVWMRNTNRVEIRNCHLRNGGRHGIMMIGHNTDNLVTGCWIQHMGVNGVSLSNRLFTADKQAITEDRCEGNRIHNCRIQHIGEIHCYASCVNAFNVSHNVVSHCELSDSVRYAVTVRGNTGEQYGPPVTVNLPPAIGNRFHHLRIFRCGQDSGDMGALHCANLNNPGEDAVNFFEQITVADTRAIPSMQDIRPDGIFIDWPKMSMHQVFRNIHIVRSQGRQIRSHGPDNLASAQTGNVSWEPDFREDLMDYEAIGLTDEFPPEFGGRPPVPSPLPAPRNLRATATAHDAVALVWEPPAYDGEEPITTFVFRDGQPIASTEDNHFADRLLTEHTTYRYHLAARAGDFRALGARSEEVQVQTPADRVPPVLASASPMPCGQRIRVAFSKPVEPAGALDPANYRFEPPLAVAAVRSVTPDCIELTVEGLRNGEAYAVRVANIHDTARARNPLDPNRAVALAQTDVIVYYPLDQAPAGRLRDASGQGGDAILHGGAVVDAHAGPQGGPALFLDGETGWAEAPADLDLGEGDFTILLRVYRENAGIILSKGDGFGDPTQWSLGWPGPGMSIALRIENNFFRTEADAVPFGRWVHLAIVKRGDTCQFYVNGEPSGEPHDLSALGPFLNDQPLRIGRRAHEPNPAFFKGRVAGLTLLRTALDATQLRAYAQP